MCWAGLYRLLVVLPYGNGQNETYHMSAAPVIGLYAITSGAAYTMDKMVHMLC